MITFSFTGQQLIFHPLLGQKRNLRLFLPLVKGVDGDAYPNTGVGELELVRNMVVHILKYLRKHHNGKIPDHAMDYVEEFITMRFPAIYKSIFGFLLHWDISMDILDRWASKGNFKFFDKAKENSVEIAAWK